MSEVAAWTRFLVGKDVPILAALDAPEELAEDTNDRIFVYKLLGQYFVIALAKQVPRYLLQWPSSTPPHLARFTTPSSIAISTRRLQGRF